VASSPPRKQRVTAPPPRRNASALLEHLLGWLGSARRRSEQVMPHSLPYTFGVALTFVRGAILGLTDLAPCVVCWTWRSVAPHQVISAFRFLFRRQFFCTEPVVCARVLFHALSVPFPGYPLSSPFVFVINLRRLFFFISLSSDGAGTHGGRRFRSRLQIAIFVLDACSCPKSPPRMARENTSSPTDCKSSLFLQGNLPSPTAFLFR